MSTFPAQQTLRFIGIGLILFVGAIFCCLACCALNQHEGFDELNKMHE